MKKVLEDVKEGNLELIEETIENLEAEYCGRFPEVKYEGESITHNSQDLIDLLKITSTQSIDFLVEENFNLSSILYWLTFGLSSVLISY